MTPTLLLGEVADLWLKPLPANLHKTDNHRHHHHRFKPINLGNVFETENVGVFKLAAKAESF